MNRLALTLLAAVAQLVLLVGVAQALPLYGARSGRTCDNCHSLPNTWYDPPEVSKRKCTLSCVGCHVDPSGGGLRNVSGQYFGDNTLPMFGAKARPLDDQGLRDFRTWFAELRTTEVPSSQPSSGPLTPATQQEDPRGEGAPPADEGLLSFGRPVGHGSSEMAWLDGRYGELNADPLLLFGADARAAFWSAGPLFFPMQADVYASLHPVEHLTIATAIGARGRARSLTLDSDGADDQGKFAVRDLWAMTHEWPYLSYLRVGRFLPQFGTRVADHTAYIRRDFGLSQEDPASRVLGIEAGINPNYPYVTGSVFVPSTRDARNPVAPGEGVGAALSAGWRDLGWGVGASGMIRRRPLDAGGNTLDGSVQWAFNPWRYMRNLSLTYLGEVAFGLYQRPYSGSQTSQLAWYHQVAWTAVNGAVFRLRYDVHDPDLLVSRDSIHRPGVGLDLTLYPGLTLGADARVGIPERGGVGEDALDVLVQIHGWL